MPALHLQHNLIKKKVQISKPATKKIKEKNKVDPIPSASILLSLFCCEPFTNIRFTHLIAKVFIDGQIID